MERRSATDPRTLDERVDDIAAERTLVEAVRLVGRFVLFALAVAMLAHLAGCARPVLIDVHDERDEPLPVDADGLPAPVADACAFYGVTCEESDEARIVLALVPNEQLRGLAVCGRRLMMRGCVRVGWAADACATHEVGHLLGLEHDDDPGNAMHAAAADGVVTDAQLEQVADEADRLAGCS